MNPSSGSEALWDACRRGTLNRILEQYIKLCREADRPGETEEQKKRGRKQVGRFPNLAGFCRYRRVSLAELEQIAKDFPGETALLFAALEDEALNSGLPPAVLSAYMKKRLGYEQEFSRGDGGGTVNVRFEHDIYTDGQ